MINNVLAMMSVKITNKTYKIQHAFFCLDNEATGKLSVFLSDTKIGFCVCLLLVMLIGGVLFWLLEKDSCNGKLIF